MDESFGIQRKQKLSGQGAVACLMGHVQHLRQEVQQTLQQEKNSDGRAALLGHAFLAQFTGKWCRIQVCEEVSSYYFKM